MDDSQIKSEIEEMISNWLYWMATRRFYPPGMPPNILAVLSMPHHGKEPPNARNDALCAAFNLVITNSPNDERLPFLYVYLKQHRPGPIKELAYDLGIDSDTVYQRAHKAANVFLAKAKELAIMNAQIQREVEDYVD
jgi:hypothetical protein